MAGEELEAFAGERDAVVAELQDVLRSNAARLAALNGRAAVAMPAPDGLEELLRA